MKEFTRERLVDHNNLFSIRTISLSEASTCEHWNLQGIEVAGCDIGFVCHYLLPGLFAVTQSNSCEQCALIGQGQTNSCILHAGNLAHRGKALIEQFSESRRIAVADIIQRRLRRYHSGWIETRRHGLEVNERADQQTGSRQQHHRQRNFTRDQPLPDMNAASSDYRFACC